MREKIIYANGEISDYCYYKDNLPDGKYYSYYESGLLKREVEFDKGKITNETLYNPNGTLSRASNSEFN